ncbi:MAG: ATP-binding cassette domain-containing protein [Hyphomicrobiaceae bacterium]|nr:ATP-binding cassette domain-containing protein [Hyphomicrobiaceae bacterium]
MSQSNLREALIARRRERQAAEGAAMPEAGTPRHGGGTHLLKSIGRIAGAWSGRAPVMAENAEGVPTPEELAAAADDASVDVAYDTRTLASLSAQDFPCVVLLTSGLSRLIVARADKDTLIVDEDGAQSPVSEAELAAEHSGTVFFIRPRGEAETETPASARSARPAQGAVRPDGRGIFLSVYRDVIGPQRKATAELLAAALISNLMVLALPLFTMAVYDRVIPHLAFDTLFALAIGLSIAMAIDLTLRFVRMRYLDAIGLRISLALQARLYRRLMGAPLARAPREPGLIASVAREVEGLCQIVPATLVSVFADLPFFLILMTVLGFIGGWVVAAPLAGIALLGVFHVIAQARSDKAALSSADLSRKQSNQLLETLGALETVKTAGLSRGLLRRFERLSDEAAHAGHIARLWTSAGSQIGMMVTQAVIAFTLIIGVFQIDAGGMTVGALAASTLIVGRAVAPIAQLLGNLMRIRHMSRTADVMALLMNAPQEEAGDRSASRRPIRGEITFQNVSFQHEGAHAPTIREASLTIRPGEKVAIIGRIGSGKSTLLKLMLRLLEPTDGAVLIDGHDARQAAPSAIRRAFGYMQQDTVLFDVSLREAICAGLSAVSEDAFERAVKISGVADFAARHPGGYSMPVGPRGGYLSGGERQAVALARVLAAEPPMLLLDEPTASMDNTLEARLMAELKPYLQNRTLVLATHRAPLLALVDRVIWVDGGRVMADGPAADVMAKVSGKGTPAAAGA